MPTEREFLRYLTDVDLLDVGLTTSNRRVLAFRVNYRAKIDGRWHEVVRYDNAHGQRLHVHRYWAPHRGAKEYLEARRKSDYATALDEALRDLDDNWRRYRSYVAKALRSKED